jgi:hypothetical protein
VLIGKVVLIFLQSFTIPVLSLFNPQVRQIVLRELSALVVELLR